MNKKILYLIAGVGVIILGILTIFDADLALLLCSIMLFVYGFSDFTRWLEGRKSGTSSLWTLLGALLSFILGGCILIGNTDSVEMSASLLIIIFSVWLMASGVFEILGAIMYRKAMTSADLGVQAPGSRTTIVAGSIMILVGLLALLVPMFAIVTSRIWITIGLILAGLRLITQARATGELEDNN